ncbi:lipopolysaccharide assembly protein LapB [Prevotella sp. P6B4]|uniref:tetratricopeptide repeat protein n=1 Tax=Prevotella sp. P6B4 TaxID=1410614 RepID=UPI000491C768|nr:tetratricopeptide repeat protein [Prevotella sp. P6B4]
MKRILITLFTINCSLFTISAQTLERLRADAVRLASRGYFNKSLDCLRQMSADSLNTEDMRLYYNNFVQLGQNDSLAYWADEMLKNNPYDAALIADYTPRLNKGWQGDIAWKSFPDKVITICRKYVEQDSTHILINRQLGEAYYNMGNYDMAQLELKKLEAIGDTCFGTLYTLGLTYQRMGDNSTAYDYLYRAYEKNDHHPYCLFVLGIVSNKVGLGAEALSYLDEAKKLLMPDRQTLFRLHKELAEAFRLKSEPDFRLEELQECMRYAEEKDVNELTYQMAQCYFVLKQRDKARDYFNKFLEATENKEYNDKIKEMRSSAQRTLRMMMW